MTPMGAVIDKIIIMRRRGVRRDLVMTIDDGGNEGLDI